jgi:hypothetical protein
VEGGRAREGGDHLLGVGGSDGGGVEARHTHPLGQVVGRPERLLHGDLLVEQHPDQERQRIGQEQLVGGGVPGDGEGRGGHGLRR